MSTSPVARLPLLLVALACLAGQAGAQGRHEGPGGRSPGPGLQLDQRYGRAAYYPSRGYVMPGLPSGSLTVAYGGGNWFYHGGVWFRPSGPRFIVSAPPFGIVVPVLPPAYTTLWLGGAAYYYANGVYYSTAPTGYVVVAPPPGADAAQPVAAPPAPAQAMPDPIIYPRNGQSAAQTEADRQECNRWATTQPTAMKDASVFQRAVEACMDGRGYTLR